MDGTAPVISVVLSVHNGEPFLSHSIASILEQSFQDFELIVVNDASVDQSAQTVKSFRDRRIVFLTNETQLGLAASLNKGIGAARGSLIARMDADDVSLPSRFEKQVSFLRENPSVGVVGTQMEVVNQEGSFIRLYEVPRTHGGIVWRLLFRNPVAHPAVMMRKELLDKHGGYDASLRSEGEDKELWIRLVRHTEFANLGEALHKYRQHGSQATVERRGLSYRMSQELGRRLASEYLKREVPASEWTLVDRSQNQDRGLSDSEIKAVCRTVLGLYRSFTSASAWSDTELTEIEDDMVSRLVSVGKCIELPPLYRLFARRLLDKAPPSLRRVVDAVRRRPRAAAQ